MSIHQALFWKSAAGGYKIFTWGTNAYGQLGLGDTVSRSSPVQVGTDSDWISASINTSSSFIKSNGTLWACGFNNQGGVGDGTTVSKSSPVQIGSLTDWLKASSANGSIALKTDGTLWSWGRNHLGQLGLGDTTDRSSPVQIGAKTGWKDVNFNGAAGFAIDSSNGLYSWGYNTLTGILGLGDTTDRSSPVQVGSLTTWSKLAVGGSGQFAGAIKTDGTLWLWGNNTYGALGQGDTVDRSSPVQVGALTNWSKVSVGIYFTIALKTNGTLWSWGYNVNGELGLGDTTDRSSPVQIGAGTNWADVVCGNSNVIAIKTDGSIWSWGFNTGGQLGLGDTTARSSPVQIGASSWQSVARNYFGGAALIA